jgi:hypothetical protein
MGRVHATGPTIQLMRRWWNQSMPLFLVKMDQIVNHRRNEPEHPGPARIIRGCG